MTRVGRGRPNAFGWFVLGLCAAAVALAVNLWQSDVAPSSSFGTAYGGAAAILMLAAAAYAVRRRMPRRGPGRAQTWLQVHVYGGLLFVVLVLMHTGFRSPHGALGWSMWLLSIYVALSGLVGLLLQRWLPRVLSSTFTTEVHLERIPELIDVVRRRTEELVASCDDRVRQFYEASLATQLSGPAPRWSYFLNAAGGIHARVSELDHLQPLMAGDGKKLDALKQLVASKFEMDAQYTLQRALRSWPAGHVPVTLLLLLLVGVHLFAVWYY